MNSVSVRLTGFPHTYTHKDSLSDCTTADTVYSHTALSPIDAICLARALTLQVIRPADVMTATCANITTPLLSLHCCLALRNAMKK